MEGLEVTFLEPDNGMFWVGCIYGRKDDYDRFAFFCGAALEYMKIFNINSDVIHCHDWQTAAVAFGDRARSKCVFTIHNLNYGADLIGRAIESCNVATTVSPTYATEVSGNPAVAPHLSKFFGIRNGIDVDIWDPALDKMLPCNYTEDNVGEAKSIVKRALREKMGLEEVSADLLHDQSCDKVNTLWLFLVADKTSLSVSIHGLACIGCRLHVLTPEFAL